MVDDHPAPASEWLPALAEALGAKKPLRAPASIAKVMAGRAAVDWLENQRGASNERAKRQLGWTLQYPDWRTGFRTGMNPRLPAPPGHGAKN